MTTGTMTVSGVDLSTYGFRCAIPGGWLDAPSVTDRTVTVPGQAGGFLLTTEAETGARTLQITGYLRQTTADLTRTQADVVKLLMASSELEIAFAEVAVRMAVGRYQSISVAQPAWPAKWATFTLQFLCPNPHLMGRTVIPYAIDTIAGSSLTLGTASSPLDINLIGVGSANPTVAYIDAQGVPKGLLRFLLTLPVGEWIEWRGFHQTAVWHKNDGTEINAIPFLDPGSEPFAADPLDGDGTVGPTISVLNCTAALLLRKAWK